MAFGHLTRWLRLLMAFEVKHLSTGIVFGWVILTLTLTLTLI